MSVCVCAREKGGKKKCVCVCVKLLQAHTREDRYQLTLDEEIKISAVGEAF